MLKYSNLPDNISNRPVHWSSIITTAESLVNPIAICDEKGKILYTNHVFANTFNVGKSDIFELFSQADEFKTIMRQLVTTHSWSGVLGINNNGDNHAVHLDVFLIKDDDLSAYFVNLADYTFRLESERSMSKRIVYEKMISRISIYSVTLDELDNFIDQSLKIMGTITGVSRVYIFSYDQEADSYNNSQEWVNEGIRPQLESLQDIPASSISWWDKRLKSKNIIAYENIAGIPAANERDMLEQQGIKAILVVPIMIGKNYGGFLGFDDCAIHRKWPVEDIDLLKTIATIIGTYIERHNIYAAEKNYQMELSFLSHTAMSLVKLITEADAYRFIARELCSRLQDSKVIAASIENRESFVYRIQGMAVGSGERGLSMVNGDLPVECMPCFTWKREDTCLYGINKIEFKDFYNKIIVDCDINDLIEPENWSSVYVIDIVQQEDLFGSVFILSSNDAAVQLTNMLKLFINQSAVALKRIKTEEYLLESEQRLSTIIQNIADGVIATDKKGRILWMNRAAEEITGWNGEKAYGRAIGQVLIIEDIEMENNIWSKIGPIADNWLEQKSHLTGYERLTLLSRDNIRKIVTCNVRRLDYQEYNKRGFILVLRDVTSETRSEVQQALSNKLESIGQLAAGIAHEINSPMQYIGDNIQFLKDVCSDFTGLMRLYHELISKLGNDEEISCLYDTIIEREAKVDLTYCLNEIPGAIEESLEGVYRVKTIVKTLKDFAHPVSTDNAAADINRGIETTVNVCRNEWKYYADMELMLEPSIPLVICNIDEINQVMLNMIVNSAYAIKKMVAAGTYSKGKIKIKTRLKDGYICISISDNGAGIPAAIMYRVFDPFFTTKDVGEGTGQGLALAHEIINKKHGGFIEVDSHECEGTTFDIYLPAGR